MKLLSIMILLQYINSNFLEKIWNLITKKEVKAKKEDLVNIFIAAHKDFNNSRYNPAYKIVVDSPLTFHSKYNLDIIYCDENSKLKPLYKNYAEMAKIYKVYTLYKSGEMSSKYVGFNHYRRYFSFLDDIPDLDNIFKDYDLILNERFNFFTKSVKQNYCEVHICQNYHELLKIIKDIRPEYYDAALEVSNWNYLYCCNIFIMKKDDFIKYCEFVFEILSEFNKRHNLTSYKTVEDYLLKAKPSDYIGQSRIHGYLAERISNFFYVKNFDFKRVKHFPTIFVENSQSFNQSNLEVKLTKPKTKKKKSIRKIIRFICFYIIIYLIIFFFVYNLIKIIVQKVQRKHYSKLRQRKKNRKKFKKNSTII